MTAARTIGVAVPRSAPSGYDVLIGAGVLDDLGARVLAAAPGAAYAVIAPDDVALLYGERVLTTLRAQGARAELFTFAPGEANKTRGTWQALTDALLERRFGRDSCVLALGGGVTGDLAGFVAATYMRSVPFVQVPTTLLAMIDASVGGKTGVDTATGKNLVGAFHFPRLVVMDPRVLRTLPPAELRAGLAEAVKHGAILDEAYFEWIGAHAGALLECDDAALAQLIARSVEIKAEIVAQDPFEQGRRALLNFGHTVGHALELRAEYGLSHGFAVAAGMVAEAAIGERLGVTAPGTGERLASLLQRLELPHALEHDLGALFESMRLDKKARHAQPRMVLLERIGAVAPDAQGAWTHTVDEAVLRRVSEGGNAV